MGQSIPKRTCGSVRAARALLSRPRPCTPGNDSSLRRLAAYRRQHFGIASSTCEAGRAQAEKRTDPFESPKAGRLVKAADRWREYVACYAHDLSSLSDCFAAADITV